MKNYYLILGVARTEGPSGIQEAFRELAKRYHPNRVGPQGTPLFQEIVEAYQILSDPERRARYNQTLRQDEGGGKAQPEPMDTGQWPQPESLVPEPLSTPRGFHTIRPSFEEMLARFRRNFTGIDVPKGERVESLNVEVVLLLEEAIRGGVLRIGVPVFSPCPVCGGSGRDWFFPCTYCQEQGMIEKEETVPVRIPPLVREGTILELPLRGLGIHNFYLRLYIRIGA